MQRLFSTFPASWPGLGLLILRVTVGAAILLARLAPDTEVAAMPAQPPWILLPLGLATACLVMGLATPAASGLILVATVVFGHDLALSSRLVLAGASLSLMMLGPGAWSIDSRIYGRKRIRIDDG